MCILLVAVYVLRIPLFREKEKVRILAKVLNLRKVVIYGVTPRPC